MPLQSCAHDSIRPERQKRRRSGRIKQSHRHMEVYFVQTSQVKIHLKKRAELTLQAHSHHTHTHTHTMMLMTMLGRGGSSLLRLTQLATTATATTGTRLTAGTRRLCAAANLLSLPQQRQQLQTQQLQYQLRFAGLVGAAGSVTRALSQTPTSLTRAAAAPKPKPVNVTSYDVRGALCVCDVRRGDQHVWPSQFMPHCVLLFSRHLCVFSLLCCPARRRSKNTATRDCSKP